MDVTDLVMADDTLTGRNGPQKNRVAERGSEGGLVIFGVSVNLKPFLCRTYHFPILLTQFLLRMP